MGTSIYCGELYDDPNDLGKSGTVVMHLMKDFPDKGYELYATNYYNSVKLFDLLGKQCTHACGTFQKDRKNIPRNLCQKNCNAPENISVCKWKDRSDGTYH